MADNYIEASFAIDLLTDEEVAWWKNEKAAEVTEDNENEHSSDWEFEAGFGRSIWFHGNVSINVEAAANTCQRFLKECRPNGSVGFSWAETCSKPMLDSIGGGAVFVTASEIHWNGSYDWLQKKQTEFAGREKGFPRINLSFQGWSRNVELTQCYDLSGGEDGVLINLAGVTSDELASKVNHGVWAIALSACLGQSSKEEIEITDVEASH